MGVSDDVSLALIVITAMAVWAMLAAAALGIWLALVHRGKSIGHWAQPAFLLLFSEPRRQPG